MALLAVVKDFKVLSTLISVNKSICDWLWENPPVTHKDNYLEKRN